ncbi:Hyaluronan synthase [Aerococcus viridans]|nr:glycosyltransferase family A protein [Aerococcus viridans]AMC01371.1 hypothetical protein AWM76_07315 [Aerococcus viridans]SUU15742.1 Hyaluronan synthase [Aerococcus viridans]
MNKDLVSVIIPNYNRKSLIKQAIASVLSQTYPNIEIIIVDDCSTDGSVEEIEQLAIKYENVFGIYSKKNHGANYSRNLGVAKASGKYLAFLDSDDAFYKTKIEKQMKALLDDSTADIKFSTCLFEQKRNITENKFLSLNDIMINNILGGFSTLLVTREAYINVGGVDIEMESCQDWDLYLKLLTKYNGILIAEQLVYYDVQTDSISNNYDKVIAGHIKIFEKIKEINVQHQILTTNKLIYHQNRLLGSLNRYFEKRKIARKYYRKNLSLDFNAESILNYLSTFISSKLYNKIIQNWRSLLR